MPGFDVHHQISEIAQTHVHEVSDDITISYFVILFSHLQSFPASRSFTLSQLFASGGLNISPSNEYSGLISVRIDWLNILVVLKGLSRDFSNTEVQKHQFFNAQLSL